jgi:predicted outer membrane protein
MREHDAHQTPRPPALCAFAVGTALAVAPPGAAGPRATTGGDPGSQTSRTGFMQPAAGRGTYEVEVPRLAAQKTSRTALKARAQMPMADHLKTENELKRLASLKSVKLWTDMPKDKQSVVYRLADTSSFDGDILKQVGLSDQGKDIGRVEKHAGNANDPGIQARAAATAPTLRADLAQAEKLAPGQSNAMRHHGK